MICRTVREIESKTSLAALALMRSRRRTGRGCNENVSGRRRFQGGAEISRQILEGLDFRIVEAEDGEKALQIAEPMSV
jgi:hypothetical protein